jgi:hypothetical protein
MSEPASNKWQQKAGVYLNTIKFIMRR